MLNTILIPRLSDVKVLLVDDLDENLFALSQILRRDGLQLVTARSGSAAFEHLLVHDFALAIIDVQMLDMDGGGSRDRGQPAHVTTSWSPRHGVVLRRLAIGRPR